MAHTHSETLKLYHGTSSKRAESILKSQRFNLSLDDDEWLGIGAYFFPFFNNAKWWARKKLKPTVLSAVLRVKNDQFLDLDISYNLTKFESFYRKYVEDLEAEGEIVPEFSQDNEEEMHRLWCYSCDAYKSEHKNLKLLAYTFETSKTTLTGFRYKQKQYCATDNTIISQICKEEIYNETKVSTCKRIV